jgi:thiol-disulfide isomerase/thioredoxin
MNKKILIICICLIGLVLAKEFKPTLPYYKLPFGKKLIYNSSSEFKGTNYTSGSNAKTQFWVWRQNPDGSLCLIICRTVKNYRIMQDTIRKDEEPQTTWAYCDLFPDGRITENISLQNFNPSQYFIPLPDDTIIAKQGWEQFDSTNQERTHYQLENNNLTDSIWTIRITKQTPFDSIYIISSHSLVYISLKRGLPIRKESEALQEYGYSAGKTTALTTLDSIKPLDSLKFKPFINELLAYFQTESTYNQILDKVEFNSPDANSLMASAENILNNALNTMNDTTIQALLNDDITNHEQIKNGLSEDSLWFARTIDKKAVEWKLKDLSEKTHTLKQYRWKIVILDFWYRGCPWCIRAMPMINQIAEDFKNRPVIVFGMNVDKNKEDALFVADKLKLIYPSLQASGIDKQYGVTGFPTLFIIDKKGIIRDAHIGFSPDLGIKVKQKIESLLEKSK